MAQECVVLSMLAVAPWAFGGEEPVFRAAAMGGVAILTLLGGIRLLLGGGLARSDGPVVLALGGLFFVTALQLLPLPPSLLAVLSPKSLEIVREMTPAQPEVFAGDSAPLVGATREWRPISVYPFATRSFLVQILILFLLAVVVRRQLASQGTFRRLAWLGFINGAALSVFALAQAQSASPGAVYWSIPTGGNVFGPFICRNHFPFYIALCLGLSAGLLVEAGAPRWRRNRPVGTDDGRVVSPLHDPRQLWIGGGMALMVVACLFSMSRGGMLALVGSTAIVAVLAWNLRGGGVNRSLALPLAVAGVVLIAIWLGTVPLESRLATLGQADTLWESRLTLWRNVLPHLANFPIFGSGGGTFQFLEPMYRQTPVNGEPYLAEFAHNEYLEAAFEGGVLRLALTVFLAVAPCWLAWRTLRTRSSGASPLAVLGGVWGLTAVALHSVFDFGIHVPSIALMAVVVATQITSVDEPAPAVQTAAGGRRTVRLALAALALPLALLLVWDAVTATLADRYRRDAEAVARTSRAEDREAQLTYWEAAIRLRPHDAVLHESAGQAYLDLARETKPPDDNGRRMLRPAAVHLVEARNRCPILAHPHVRLAELCPVLTQHDSVERYLQRAARLLPSEPEIWYALGRQYLEDGRPLEALRAWKQNLELTDRYLPAILNQSVSAFGVDTIRRELLPDRAEIWLAAADHLYPGKEQRQQRQPFLRHALVLLERDGGAAAESSHEKAVIQTELRMTADAETSYRAALAAQPRRHDWRLEFARFLRQNGRLADAKVELEALLERAPDHAEARETLLIVQRELQLKDD